MRLTDKQKIMINYINVNKVITFYELIKINKKIKEEKAEKRVNEDIDAGQAYFIIKGKDIPEIIKIIVDIDNLCTILQNKNLIGILDDENNTNNIKFYFKGHLKAHHLTAELNTTIKKYANKKFITTTALGEYIFNNYKTNEEIEIIRERIARKYADNTTRRIAIISLIVSFFIAIGTTIFNYLTYTKEREMIIKNPGEINYPVEIKNLDKYIESQERYIEKLDEIIKIINKESN
jgi:hypothetical protein